MPFQRQFCKIKTLKLLHFFKYIRIRTNAHKKQTKCEGKNDFINDDDFFNQSVENGY